MDVRRIMTHVLVVGGISSVHEIAHRLGAELTLVKTAASQTMLAADAYARIVDVSDHGDGDRARLARKVTEAVAGTTFDGILCLHGSGLGSVAHGVVVDGRVEWSGVAPTSEIVLKPVDGRASRGVTFHSSAGELQEWLDSHPGGVEGYLAEERKLGREFSVESLIVRSGDAWHGVTAKSTNGAVESGHLHPAPLEASERSRIVAAATTCLEALGIDRGMFHTEVILDGGGAAHVVETHLRGGGDNILDLVRSATGLDLPELYVQDVLEGLDEIPAAINLGFASSHFAFPVELGVISGWESVEEARAMPGVVAVTTLLSVGDRVSPLVNSSYGRSVCALAHADDPVNAYKRARAAALTPRPVVEPA